MNQDINFLNKKKEIIRSLYGIKKPKHLSKSRIKDIEENLYKLEKVFLN